MIGLDRTGLDRTGQSRGEEEKEERSNLMSIPRDWEVSECIAPIERKFLNFRTVP